MTVAPDARVPVQMTKWYRLRQNGTAMARYLLDSEVHTFAFSVAANAILSFIPLTVLLYTLALSVFHSQAMAGVVNDMVNYFLPSVTKQPNWLASNLEFAAQMSSRHGVQALSLMMILVSCTGIFLPLEVALNQAWGVRKSRNYLLNQAIAFGLAAWMVVLGMTAMLLSAGQRQILAFLFFHHTDNWVFNSVSYVWLALCTGAAVILFFFSIYWILPNRRVPAKSVMRSSIVTGLVWLGSRIVFVDVLPHLDLKTMYGPFSVSVGLLFWGYISGLILFAGAQVSVARMGTKRE
ncbi:MAG TPA: YihY/virulence factor BrkB family protein [Terracidiphilus sp.]|nr:YihY/virulence factor BrkB family protein [Terracidiphilus sp.]